MELELVPMEPGPENGQLSSVAFDIADRYRTTPSGANSWDASWQQMIAALRQRCPGHTDAEYQKALNDGFTHSR